MPPDQNGSPLEAALTFYSSVSVNAEGDSSVTEETLEGAGRECSLLDVLFGSIIQIAQSLLSSPYYPPPGSLYLLGLGGGSTQRSGCLASPPQLNPTASAYERDTPDNDNMAAAQQPYQSISADDVASAVGTHAAAAAAAASVVTIQAAERTAKAAKETSPGRFLEHTSEHVDYLDVDDHDSRHTMPLREIDVDAEECADELIETTLTSYLPEPGYFIAGAAAGGVSRTATAPLDRLKVFLLVNTQSKPGAIDAVKGGEAVQALRATGRPIRDAIVNLYKTGGFRTFFAGKYCVSASCLRMIGASWFLTVESLQAMDSTLSKSCQRQPSRCVVACPLLKTPCDAPPPPPPAPANPIFQFGSYEFAKRTLANFEGHGDPTMINPYSKFAAGGVAGMTAQ